MTRWPPQDRAWQRVEPAGRRGPPRKAVRQRRSTLTTPPEQVGADVPAWAERFVGAGLCSGGGRGAASTTASASTGGNNVSGGKRVRSRVTRVSRAEAGHLGPSWVQVAAIPGVLSSRSESRAKHVQQSEHPGERLWTLLLRPAPARPQPQWTQRYRRLRRRPTSLQYGAPAVAAAARARAARPSGP